MDKKKAKPSPNNQAVWNLNLDQIEPHTGRVLEKVYVDPNGLGPSTYPFEKGTVLYSKLRPYLNKVVVADDAGIATTELVPLQCNPDKVIPEYLAHFLRSPDFLTFATTVVAGAKMPRMVMDEFWGFEIPVPPLSEQRRIAAILDKADALRAKRKEAIAQLDALSQSIFIGMFGDPETNSKGWKVRQLDEVATFFAGSTLPVGVEFIGQEGGSFLLKVSDLNLEGNESRLVTCKQWSSRPGAAACTCPPGSVVFPKRGGAIGTNKRRLTTRVSILDPNLMAIYPNPSHLDLPFLYQWFLSFDLESIVSGSSVPQLNKRDLAPLNIITPPIALQREFSSRISVLETQRGACCHSLVEFDALFSSLQHRAFRGEL